MMVGIGNPVYDLIDTPLIRTDKRVLSGCSTNACIVCAQLKTKAVLVGCVGKDFRKQTESILSDFGVEPVLYPSKETGGFSLKYDDTGNRTLKVLGRANPITKVPKEVLSADVILLGPILQEIDPSMVVSLSENESLLFCDPQGFLREIRDGQISHIFPRKFRDVLPVCDILKPNEPEASIMTGEYASKHPEEVMETLYSYGSSVCIVTLAEKGSLIYDGSELIRIPPFETVAKDPTGAGDTYAAGFIIEYLRRKSLYQAGLFASCTASLWVESIGPCIDITEEKVRERMELLE